MKAILLKTCLVFLLWGKTALLLGQSRWDTEQKPPLVKPFKILSNGRQITIDSKQPLKSIVGWTAGGHRFVEEKNMKTLSFTFFLPPKEKFFFVMIITTSGKQFTEKIGIP